MEPHRLVPAHGIHAATPPQPVQVHVVDDDRLVRSALVRLLGSNGYDAVPHVSAEDFLAAHDAGAGGCILLDIGLPGLDGLHLQQRLAQVGDGMPIVFITGCADVPMCADAMREGAVDFLTKPIEEEALMASVRRALQRDEAQRAAREHRLATEQRLATLTPREREVLRHVMNGRLNKQIAGDLGTAEKTVKVHRARAMEKMHVRSVAELVRMVERAGAAG